MPAFFNKTPSPANVIRAEHLFEPRRLARRGPLICIWARNGEGRLVARWVATARTERATPTEAQRG